MANSYTKSPIIIDTSVSSDITGLLAGFKAGMPLKIGTIRWVGAGAGDDVLITDMSDRPLWVSKATAANFVDNSRIRQRWNGFKVPTIDGGVLYIYLADD